MISTKEKTKLLELIRTRCLFVHQMAVYESSTFHLAPNGMNEKDFYEAHEQSWSDMVEFINKLTGE